MDLSVISKESAPNCRCPDFGLVLNHVHGRKCARKLFRFDPAVIGILTQRSKDQNQEKSYSCVKSRFIIGRAPESDLCIDDRSVSRVHAAIIRRDNGHYQLEDQDSRNGTKVNGIPVVQKRLRDRDVVTFGDINFDFNVVDNIPESDAVGGSPKPARSDNIHTLRDQTLTRIAPDVPPDATIAAEGWQIVRLFSENPSDQLEGVLEQVVHDLSGVVGIRHILLFLPFSEEGVCRFIRRGDRAGRYYSEERLNGVLKDGVAIGIASNRVIPLKFGKVSDLDAVYIPFAAGKFGRGCLYADAEDIMESARVEMLRIAAEAIRVGISLHLGGGTHEAGSPVPLEEDATGAEIIGCSPLLQQVIRQAVKAAVTDYPVLIRGETGTGKELLSRLIHNRSKRCDAPHIAVNCGATTETLLMSDLFGHEKGAFTGAVGTRKGYFENVSGGTIFLDEIGEAPLPMQAALLRVLQEKKITRVGGSKSLDVDVRIIAATNRDLEKCVEQGTFRRDLLHRLNTVELVMPPLRDRHDDILSLVQHFIQRECLNNRRALLDLAPAALDSIMKYEWPGNIRELENAIKWAVTMAEDRMIHVEDLPQSIAQKKSTVVAENVAMDSADKETLASVERTHILAVVSTSRTKAEAARRLGIGRNTLYAKLREFGIDPES